MVILMKRAALVFGLIALHNVLAPAVLSAAPHRGNHIQRDNPYKAPIFRDRGEDNTVNRQADVPEAAADQAAYLEMDDETRAQFEDCVRQHNLGTKLTPSSKANCDYLTAWDQLINLLGKISSEVVVADKDVEPIALRLGSSGHSTRRLDSDLTNYAPDNFCDLEVMKLFAINEMLRKSGSSSSNGMKRVNERMLRAYIQALAGVESIGACASVDEKEKCKICGLNLSKPCVTYPCGHVYHQKCALTSTAKQGESTLHYCDQCGLRYRVPLVEPKAKS